MQRKLKLRGDVSRSALLWLIAADQAPVFAVDVEV